MYNAYISVHVPSFLIDVILTAEEIKETDAALLKPALQIIGTVQFFVNIMYSCTEYQNKNLTINSYHQFKVFIPGIVQHAVKKKCFQCLI